MKTKSVEQILNSYPFSRHFCVGFTLKCCNEIKHLMNDNSLKCLELTQRWYDGDKSITEKMLSDAATSASTYASYAASYASSAAASYASFNAASSYASYASYASAAAYWCEQAKPSPKDWTKEILLNMIDKDLSELEKIMIGMIEEREES